MRAPLAIAVLITLAACSPDRTSGPPERPTPVGGQLLECRADAAALTLTCAPVQGPQAGPGTGLFGGQGINLALQSKQVRYNAGTQILSADISVENLMGGAIGTQDGTTVTGVDIFVIDDPVAVPTGTVTIDNPTGLGSFTGTDQPYFHYHELLPPGTRSAELEWHFKFAGGADSFTFYVLVSADTPALGAIQNWVLLPEFGAPPLQGVYGFGADGQVIYGDSGEVSYRVGGVWRSIFDTLVSPVVSSRHLFAFSTRDIWSYVDTGGIRLPRRWDGGNWREMNAIPGYPGQGAVGIGTTGPGSYWAFGTGLWRLLSDTLWDAEALPSGADTLLAMAPIGGDLLLVDEEGQTWYYDGDDYTAIAGAGPGQAGVILILSVDTTHIFAVSSEPGEPDIRRWASGAWSTEGPPVGYAKGDGFVPVAGVAISNSEAYLVANEADHGVVLRWNGTAWSVDRENLTIPYTGIWARHGNEIHLSLGNGDVEVRADGVWDSQDPRAAKPDPNLFPAAWLSGEGAGYLVNEVGWLYRYSEGVPFIVDTLPVGGAPTSLWTSGVNDVWIAHGGNQLSRYDGIAATSVSVPFDARAVGGSGPNDVWAVGVGGEIARFTDLPWASATVNCGGSCEDWNAVWALSPSFAVAVGNGGQIGIWDGTDWTVTTHGSDDLFAVSGSSVSDVWAGGAQGTGWRWNGTLWSADAPATGQDILGAWMPSAGEGYVIANKEVHRWNGVAWAEFAVPEMQKGKGENRAISGAGDDAFIVGARLFRGLR